MNSFIRTKEKRPFTYLYRVCRPNPTRIPAPPGSPGPLFGPDLRSPLEVALGVALGGVGGVDFMPDLGSDWGSQFELRWGSIWGLILGPSGGGRFRIFFFGLPEQKDLLPGEVPKF